MTPRGPRPPDLDPRLLASGPTGVLAHDWAGASEAAAAFRGGTGEAWVAADLLRPGVPAGDTLALVAGHADPTSAQAARLAREAARALRAHRCARHFLHCGPDPGALLAAQLGEALDALDLPLAVVAAADPGAGVLCVGGYQLVEGRPACLPRDNVPVGIGHLPTLLGRQGRLATAHLGLDAVWQGPQAVAQALTEAWAAGRRVLVVDAAREQDLAAIARGIVITPYPILPVGSAGLARALQPHRMLELPPSLPRALGRGRGRPPVLTVAGGPHPRLRDQVARAARGAALVTLDVERLLLRGEAAAEEAFEAARAWLTAGRDVVLTSPLDPKAWQQAVDLAHTLGGGAGLGRLVVDVLGTLGARLAQTCPLSGLLVAGRDLSGKLAAGFGGAPCRVVGPLGSGAVLLEVGDSRLRWAVKAGASGGPEAIDALAAQLRLSQLP